MYITKKDYIEWGIYESKKTQVSELDIEKIILIEINMALRGHTSSLNELWARVKNGYFTKDDYYEIEKVYSGKSRTAQLKYKKLFFDLDNNYGE